MAGFEHRVYSPWSTRIFWRETPDGNSAAATPETGTRCVLQVGPDCFYNNREFNWPSEKPLIEKLERMLEASYELGRASAKKDIRDVLGVKDPRP